VCRKIIFHTLSLIKGCEEKKSKCVENDHSKLETTRKRVIDLIFFAVGRTFSVDKDNHLKEVLLKNQW
jgi:hypothetical protein